MKKTIFLLLSSISILQTQAKDVQYAYKPIELDAQVTNNMRQPQLVSVINEHLKGENSKTEYLSTRSNTFTEIPFSVQFCQKQFANRLAVGSKGGVHSFYLHTTPKDPDIFGSPISPIYLMHSWYSPSGQRMQEKVRMIIKKTLPNYRAEIEITKNGKIKVKISHKQLS